MADRPGSGSSLLRFGAAIALVLATFNPTRWNYLRWALDDVAGFGPWKLIVGLLLGACWIFYVRAALQSIGIFGAGMIAALIAAFVWLAVENGWLALGDTNALLWIALLGFGLILGIGLSWSRFRTRVTGQVDVDHGGAG
ncbi:MAG TPA: DUF6524 family protein [Myxococcota bacterium]|jgi:hypothetical protein